MNAAHHVWPTSIKELSWPRDGIMYSYEHRGYIIPEKLEHWLNQAFGFGKAKYVVRFFLVFPHTTFSTTRVCVAIIEKPSIFLIFFGVLVNEYFFPQLFNQRIYIKAPRKPTSVGGVFSIS